MVPGSTALRMRWDWSSLEVRKSMLCLNRSEAFAWDVRLSSVSCVICMIYERGLG